ncbi:MAG: hypothetical protein GY723_11275 [bacterium]|nr:hypothetical protein [bacterium]MCP5067319.1 hypothetical protein [bacterium]
MARSTLTLRVIALTALLVLLGAGRAQAIASIRVTPSNYPLSGLRPADTTPLSFVWTVQTAPGPARSISSTGGAFVLDIGSRQTLLTTGSLTVQTAASGGAVIFTETVSLPSSLIAEAQARGARRILYVRSFEATYTVVEQEINPSSFPPTRPTNRHVRTTAEAAATLNLGGGMGGPLQVYRLLLRFDDGSPLRILSQSSPLKVFADVSYEGGGTLEGVWEVADPNSSSGAPVFVPLARVHRFLGAGQRITVEGPPLPTQHTGLHLVRFRVEAPRSPEEDPIIRYRVVSPGVEAPPVRLAAHWPPAGVQISPKTSFQWQALPEAAAYRLEFFSRSQAGDRWVPLFSSRGQVFRDVRGHGAAPLPYEDAHATEGLSGPDPLSELGEPATGLLLPAHTTSTFLTPVALRHVEMDELYLWRIRALAEDGSTLGLSPPRLIRAPGADLAEAPEAP